MTLRVGATTLSVLGKYSYHQDKEDELPGDMQAGWPAHPVGDEPGRRCSYEVLGGAADAKGRGCGIRRAYDAMGSRQTEAGTG